MSPARRIRWRMTARGCGIYLILTYLRTSTLPTHRKGPGKSATCCSGKPRAFFPRCYALRSRCQQS